MSTTQNLKKGQGIEKLQHLASEIKICLFCTNLKTGDGTTTRPMSVQEVDDEGNMWFLSDKTSDKNKEIKKDGQVRLYFSEPGKSSYMVVNGAAEISTDPKKIEDIWTPLAKTWFKEGKTDPNVTAIKVNVESAHYWDVDGNKMINFFKMLASVATGTNLVTAKEGDIKLK